MKLFWKRFLAGLGIGVGAAIPGVSGGTIAVILKVYESLISAVSNLFKSFKKNIIILIPILLGVIIAIIPSIILMDKALQGFVFGIVCLFAGFIIGSFPSITDEVKNESPTKKDKIILVITLSFALLLGVLSVVLGDKLNLQSIFDSHPFWLYLILIPVGFIGAVALVIPGISGSMLLLILGFYKPLVNCLSKWFKEMLQGNFTNTGALFLTALSFVIGVIIGFFIISKIMNKLLNKYHRQTFYGIIGFIIGSTITLFFNNTIFEYYQMWARGESIAMPMWVEILVGCILLVVGAILSYALVRFQRKQKQ